MQEKLLHFVWQYQFMSSTQLTGSEGEPIMVLHPGVYNQNAGPDFLNSRLLTDHIEWQGAVELHVQSSDWDQHGHTSDPAYNCVILHVVWIENGMVKRYDGTRMPTLELQGRIPLSILQKYKDLSESLHHIACAGQIQDNDRWLWKAAERSFSERAESKTRQILDLVRRNKGDWELTVYQCILRAFGFGKNGAPFERLARLLPHSLILRHRDHPLQVEALFFGIAGFLDQSSQDPHHRMLRSEYFFLKDKYSLSGMAVHEWKFMRMRPANFPTVRLAQLSALFCKRESLFSSCMDCQSISDVYEMFRVAPGSYWLEHYHFGRRGKSSQPGKDAIHLLIINVLAPLRSAYLLARGDNRWEKVCQDMLEQVPSEENRYSRLWKKHGIEPENAYQSQGLLSLYKNRCSDKKCLTCDLGIELLKQR